MKERPILFSTPMVRAILDGRKTMTRRVVKYQDCEIINQRPYKPGDRLWVRETWHKDEDDPLPYYKASEEHPEIFKWKPSIFMSRTDSRIDLEITNVRVEMLKEIIVDDIIKEGMSTTMREHDAFCDLHEQFIKLWDSINGKKYPWESNPWVWVIEFRRAA